MNELEFRTRLHAIADWTKDGVAGEELLNTKLIQLAALFVEQLPESVKKEAEDVVNDIIKG